MGTTIKLAAHDGEAFDVYVEESPGAKAAVIVLQEWWGLNDQIKSVCGRLADAGFTSAAPDLYRGRVALDEAEAEHLSDGLDWDRACNEQIAATVAYLAQRHDRSAVIGFCMGGALAVLAGLRLKEVDAVVAFYGLPPVESFKGQDVTAAFQGHFALHDEWITPDAVSVFVKEMASSVDAGEIYFYDAHHAFANEQGKAYSPKDADLAWSRTLAFLERLKKAR
jgi:carboxymethylenebutenolidase